MLENPKKEVLRTETCHGHRPKEASFPPTMRVSGRGKSGGTPHSVLSFSPTAETVGTVPKVLRVVDEGAMVVGTVVIVVVVCGTGVVVVVLVVVVVVLDKVVPVVVVESLFDRVLPEVAAIVGTVEVGNVIADVGRLFNRSVARAAVLPPDKDGFLLLVGLGLVNAVPRSSVVI